MDKGIAEVRGFSCGVGKAGIKAGGDPDVLLVVSSAPCNFATVFTSNDVKAAPVKVLMESVPHDSTVTGILANSGNANACTGEEGVEVARYVKKYVERIFGGQFLIASTGIIGVVPDRGKLVKGIEDSVNNLGKARGELPARAIMTTDTFPKLSFVDCGSFSIGAVAKGAGMIDPAMSTMLAFIVTDAAVSSGLLREMLFDVVEESFNAITVDGDMSTNDCVFMLSNGISGILVTEGRHDGLFFDALRKVTKELAFKIVKDGEGATKVIRVLVEGAKDRLSARTVAEKIAKSLLVKTAIHGCDPNWGRVVAAAGSAGVGISENKLRVFIGNYLMYERGSAVNVIREDVVSYMRASDEIVVKVDLGEGSNSFECLTCDLSCEYVKINAEYGT